MPRTRKKSNALQTAPVSKTQIPPLLDSIRLKLKQEPCEQAHEKDLNGDDFNTSMTGWECDADDWDRTPTSNNGSDAFPETIRSLEKKDEQKKCQLFPLVTTGAKFKPIEESKLEVADQMQRPSSSSEEIDLIQLNSIVTDLIASKRDKSAYTDFLSILQRFSVRIPRDDHLEETVYHLIQAGVSYIRSNEHRFDPSRLQECYRQRYFMKMNLLQ